MGFEWELIELKLDDELDGYVRTKSIDTVKTLFLSEDRIESLKGLEDFKALERLFFSGEKLTELKVSNNTALKYLVCFDTKITYISLITL